MSVFGVLLPELVSNLHDILFRILSDLLEFQLQVLISWKISVTNNDQT